MSFEYNFSKDSDYHTQINNRFIPYSTCNMTSEAMGLIQAGYTINAPEGMQEEDYLTSQVESADQTHVISSNEDALEYAKKTVPWAFDQTGKLLYPLNEIHVMIDWAANKVIGGNVSSFTDNSSVVEMAQRVFVGYGIVLSGVYTLSNGKKLGHITSLAGFVSSKEVTKDNLSTLRLSDITHMIIDDPYGNFYTDYKDCHGNNIHMPIDDFIKIQQVCGSSTKWAHYIIPNSK